MSTMHEIKLVNLYIMFDIT